MDTQPGHAFLSNCLLFTRALRQAGIPIGLEQALAFARALEEDFEARILPFEQNAARAAALVAARRRQNGRSIEIRDAQIAGIASARRATLATRNTRHFADLGIALVDPWTPG